jgi:hypothetical protein
MNALVVLIVALPLSVEVLGALFGLRDGWADTASKASALERLATPLLCWGGLWWLAGIDMWRVMLAALVVVLILHVATYYAGRVLISRPRFQTHAIDTDSDDDPFQKKSPGDNWD